MRPSFAYGPSPMIVGVIRQRTVRDAIAEMKNGEVSGARGFDLHLDALDPAFRTLESIREIVNATDKPILALNYNTGYDYTPLNMTEAQRTDLLLLAAEAGVSAVDLQGYSFDPEAKAGFVDDAYVPEGLEFLLEKRPKELALKPEVLARQLAFIEKAKAFGAEVLVSLHFGVHLSAEQLIALARYAHSSKGADIVKIVTPCATEEELAECYGAVIAMKKALDFPFSYHANGKMGLSTRKVFPMLGSHIMFCNVEYGYSSNFEQLHLGSMVEAYRNLGAL